MPTNEVKVTYLGNDSVKTLSLKIIVICYHFISYLFVIWIGHGWCTEWLVHETKWMLDVIEEFKFLSYVSDHKEKLLILVQ